MAEKLRINLGCGPDVRPGWTNVDLEPGFGAEVQWNLNEVPYPFDDGTAERIYAAQLLEHLTLHTVDFLKEAYRILDSDGVLEIVLPNMFSIRNRMLFLFGRIEGSREWNPHHVKLVHPRYLTRLARHIGFDAKLEHQRLKWLPRRDLLAGSTWMVARKRR